MFYRYEHYMSISHMVLIVAIVHVDVWCQNLGMSFMIWFTTGLPWFHGDDQRSGWEQLGIYFGAACSGDRRRERKHKALRKPIEERWKKSNTKNKKEQMCQPPRKKKKSPTPKREEKQHNSKRKKGVKRKEKRSKATQLQGKKKAWRKENE